MILKLSIKNYILIEELYVDFKEGFSALTGETGAGKSIILGALNLISGSRVDHQIVGSKNEKCIVEGKFLISETLADFFDYIAGCDTFDYNKPDPRHLTTVIEILGGDLNKSLILEQNLY